MSSTISQFAVPGGTELAISMSNSTWARPVSLPSNWSKIRIGLRLWITDLGGGPTSLPYFALGLCNNTTNLVGDSQTNYFVGVITNTSNWNYSAGTNNVYFGINVVSCVKTGSLLTSGSNITTDCRFSNTSSKSSVFFLDITKGTPFYTFNIFSIIASVPTNCTATTFQQQVVLNSPTVSGCSFGTSVSMSVNEALSGSLNAINCWWNRSDLYVQVEDVAMVVLS